MNYRIKETTEVCEDRKLCAWLLLKLEDDDDQLFLIVKKVDSDIDVRLYYVEPGIEPGSREDMLQDGFEFLFEPFEAAPEKLDDLEFAREIFVNNENEEGEVEEVAFRAKRHGVLFGSISQGGTNAKEKYKTCIAEYQSLHDTENPEMMIYEFWTPNNEGCETLYFLRGSDLSVSEVDLMLN